MAILKKITHEILSPSRSVQTTKELDGLRGIAIIIVFLGHILHLDPQLSPGIGSFAQVGVYLFFVLSAYLLTTITVNQFQKGFTPSILKNFFVRRAFRIFPMYYFTLLLVYFSLTFRNMMFGGRDIDWLDHILFKYPQGNFWVISVELEFYLLIPILAYFIVVPKARLGKCLPLIAFALLSLSLSKIMTHLFTFPLNFPHLLPFLSIFLFGVLIANIEYSFKVVLSQIPKMFWNLTFYFGILCYLFLIPSIGIGFFSAEEIYSEYYSLIGAFASALVLISALNGSGHVVKFLKFTYLRYIGIISYSIYLLHILVMSYFAGSLYTNFGISLTVLFVWTLVTLLSTLTYLLVERPFINRATKVTSL
jgi:peptidoglycan/LPS O-acetylase OafA/YrhL